MTDAERRHFLAGVQHALQLVDGLVSSQQQAAWRLAPGDPVREHKLDVADHVGWAARTIRRDIYGRGLVRERRRPLAGVRDVDVMALVPRDVLGADQRADGFPDDRRSDPRSEVDDRGEGPGGE